MKKLGVCIAALATTALTCGFAHGADIPLAPAYPAPVIPAVPVYTWTGIYFGVNGGYGFGQSTPMSLFSDSFSAFNYNANGALVGGTAGAQIQSGHTVLGIEADIDLANVTGSKSGSIAFNGFQIGTATLSCTVSSISTLRTRVGYAADNWLFYVTGGWAVTNEASSLSGPIGFICGTGAVNSPPCTSPTNLHLGSAAASNMALRKI